MHKSGFDKKAATWDAEMRRVELARDVNSSDNPGNREGR